MLSLPQSYINSEYFRNSEPNDKNLELFNPLPDNKILDWTKLKQIADDILKCI